MTLNQHECVERINSACPVVCVRVCVGQQIMCESKSNHLLCFQTLSDHLRRSERVLAVCVNALLLDRRAHPAPSTREATGTQLPLVPCLPNTPLTHYLTLSHSLTLSLSLSLSVCQRNRAVAFLQEMGLSGTPEGLIST